MKKETFHIQWHITNFCNLRCKHCYQNDFSPKEDLSFLQLKKIIENVFSFLNEENKNLIIDITGGEVFLHKDWRNLIQFLSNSSIVKELSVITNGFFLERETINFLKNFPKLKIKISTEGIDEKLYEFFRGNGSFLKFMKVIENLQKTNFEKVLMFTLLETNYSQIEKIFDFLDKYKFDKLIVERFIPLGRGEKIKENIISLENWVKTINFLIVKCGLEENISSVLPYRAFMVKIINKNYKLYGAPCIIGKDGIAIMPDGNVFPCRRFPLKIGNLLEKPLKEILENPILKMLTNRKFLKGKCNRCEISECLGCRALAFAKTGNFLEEDPLCFLRWTNHWVIS